MLDVSGECPGPQCELEWKDGRGKAKDGSEAAGKDYVNVILSEMGRTGVF